MNETMSQQVTPTSTEPNEIKHTPGPWTTGGGIVRGANSASICCAPCWDVDDKTAKANAHLIAAAPEMLEALKLAPPFLSRRSEYSRDVLRTIKAAIAKAEGTE
jgi:hypothetical protein